ncbi:MAG: penicillin-binding protein 2 [Candidatus Magasanikbacteria bacterium]
MEGIHKRKREKKGYITRLRVVAFFCILFGILIILRLFILMALQHGFYSALAAGSQEIYSQLIPERGNVYIQDSRSDVEYPLAINKEEFTVFVDTRDFKDEDIELVLEGLSEVFEYEEEQKEKIMTALMKEDDPYEIIEKRVDEEAKDTLAQKDLPGIGFVPQNQRFYPEGRLAAHVIGFVGKDEDGSNIGRYGIEGYWNRELAGQVGFLESAKSLAGKWIPLAGRSLKEAEDGVDVLLTIDRTLQFKACERLRAAVEEYQASSASLIIMDTKTGAIRTMCSLPDFDPNIYNEVDSIEVFNNTSIFSPYEPGSIFKPLVMAAALEEGVVTPEKVFHDVGEREADCLKSIKNADEKEYGDITMTGILENSVNTGMVYVTELLGKKKFREYVEKFGFGVVQGISLDTEVSGRIDTLEEIKTKDDEIDCYTATASFGQGISATPLQMVTAFGALANGGLLMKPYIVQEIRNTNGKKEVFEPEEIGRVVSGRAASLAGAMMVKVVDNGHAEGAAVPGYYVAGKTGTAQIAEGGVYIEETNHSFVGFAPVDDPKFVMLIKFEKPQRQYSASTAAPVFGDIAAFILKYYSVPPSR